MKQIITSPHFDTSEVYEDALRSFRAYPKDREETIRSLKPSDRGLDEVGFDLMTAIENGNRERAEELRATIETREGLVNDALIRALIETI